jgi:DNA-binding HxlR family transcriptional regulator
MQRKDFGAMLCPVARTLERVGEWWSIMILRDAFQGVTRFDQFQTSLGIAPNMLTRRLDALVDAGLLARRLYSKHPPRHEYVLTPRGRDFWPVLISLLAYGNRHFAPEGVATEIADAATGKTIDPVLVDRASGAPLDSDNFKLAPGPAASPTMRLRMKYADKRRSRENADAEWTAYAALRENQRAKKARPKKVRSKA